MSTQQREFKRDLIQGSTLGVGVILVLALVVLVNYLAARHYQRVDFTDDARFSLSEKTKNILASLNQEIEFIMVLDPQESFAYADTHELLERYAAASPWITFREVDAVKNPVEAQRLVDVYEIDRRNVVVVATQDDRRVVDESDLLEMDYSGIQMGESAQVKSYLGEQAFSSAIVALVSEDKPAIAWIAGHGEVALDDFGPTGVSYLRQYLGDDNFDLEEVITLGLETLPESYDLAVIAGPKTAFLEGELDLLDRYLAAGGRLLLAVDPILIEGDELADLGLEAWLALRGVNLGRDVVVDPSRALPFFGVETLFAQDYGSHEVSRSLREAGLPAIFSLARSVTPGSAEDLTVTPLVSTSSEGWGETSLGEALQNLERDENDTPGPVNLGVVVESQRTTSESAETGLEGVFDPSEPEAESYEARALRMVVLGDSNILTDEQFTQAGNGPLVLNLFNWLVERETQLGIPPKDPATERLNLTPTQLATIQWIVILLPVLAAILGFGIWHRRRR